MALSVFVAVWLVGFISTVVVIRRLRVAHEAIWVELGRPSFGLSNSILSCFRLLKYMITFRFITRGDLILTIAGGITVSSLLAMILVVPFLVRAMH